MADSELRHLMKLVDMKSFKELENRAVVSRGAIARLRKKQADLVSYRDLMQIAKVLRVTIADLISKFSQVNSVTRLVDTPQVLEPNDREIFEQEVLTKLESLLLQLPTAAYAITNNPHFPARNLLLLLKPLDILLSDWNIQAIAPVGTVVSYDPRWHQDMDGEDLSLGDQALVRYIGYRRGEQLLYRARVSRIFS
jgi:transcriptional regulator with XRE-family HTH domain